MKSKKFVVIAILYLVLCIGNNLIHPITTPFLESLQIDKVFFGYYYALMAFGVVVGAMVCGVLSNKVSRKYLTCIGFIGYAFFQMFFGTINFNPYIVMIWRFLSGFFVAFPNTLFIVFAADELKQEERVKGLTIMSLVSLLGVSLGYEIGGLMHDYVFFDNYLASFILQSGWTILGAVLCFIIMDDKKVQTKKGTALMPVIKSLNIKQVIFFISLFIFSLASISVSKFFEPLFQSIGDKESVSTYLAHFTIVSNLISILVIWFLVPVIKKRFEKRSSLLFTILLGISSILILVTFSSRNNDVLTILFFSVYLVYVIIKNLITPLEQDITIEDVGEDKFGPLLSFRQSILSFGQVLGPLLLANAFSYDMHLPFYIAVILYFVGFILMFVYLLIGKKDNKKEECNND